MQYPGLPPVNTSYNLAPAVSGRYVRYEPDPLGANRNFHLAELQVFAPYTCVSLVITQSPPSRTVSENATPTLVAGASVVGGPQTELSQQWQREDGFGGWTNIPGAIALSYTAPPLALTESGTQFRVLFAVSGQSRTSSVATITVVNDVEPPRVESVSFGTDSSGATRIIIHYSELIELTSLTDTINYTLDPGLELVGVADGGDGRSAVVTINGLTEQLGVYGITIDSVIDLVGLPIQPVTLRGVVPFSGVNLAVAGTATSSSTGFSAPAARANDGNTDGAFGDGSVFHSAAGAPENPRFWEVDLGLEKALSRVHVWFRTDCCGDRNDDFTVKVLAADRTVLWSQTYAGRPPADVELTIDPPVIGRIVRWEPNPSPANGVRDFHLAEVQVFGGYDPVALHVERSLTEMTLTWAATLNGFTLESSDCLPGVPADWTPVARWAIPPPFAQPGPSVLSIEKVV